MRIYTQLKAERPPEWVKMNDEIETEAQLQRKALQELRDILEPGLLKSKLALLGNAGNGEKR
jgi:hypothetical protein